MFFIFKSRLDFRSAVIGTLTLFHILYRYRIFKYIFSSNDRNVLRNILCVIIHCENVNKPLNCKVARSTSLSDKHDPAGTVPFLVFLRLFFFSWRLFLSATGIFQRLLLLASRLASQPGEERNNRVVVLSNSLRESRRREKRLWKIGVFRVESQGNGYSRTFIFIRGTFLRAVKHHGIDTHSLLYSNDYASMLKRYLHTRHYVHEFQSLSTNYIVLISILILRLRLSPRVRQRQIKFEKWDKKNIFFLNIPNVWQHLCTHRCDISSLRLLPEFIRRSKFVHVCSSTRAVMIYDRNMNTQGRRIFARCSEYIFEPAHIRRRIV